MPPAAGFFKTISGGCPAGGTFAMEAGAGTAGGGNVFFGDGGRFDGDSRRGAVRPVVTGRGAEGGDLFGAEAGETPARKDPRFPRMFPRGRADTELECSAVRNFHPLFP